MHTLLLDAGGVLVCPNWDRVSETLARHGVEAPADGLRRAEPIIKFAIDHTVGHPGSSDASRWHDYLDGVLLTAGVARSPNRDEALVELRRYHATHNLWESVPADVVPSLEAFRALGLTLAVASNANGTIESCLERVGLLPYFDVVCDSHVEGVEKPDPRFFEVVMSRAGGQPETTMHVGDLYHVDVVGARRSGLQTILLDRDDLFADFDAERVKTLQELVERLR